MTPQSAALLNQPEHDVPARELQWPNLSALEARAALSRALEMIESQKDRIRSLEAEAQTDPMTGVLNQRGFYKALSREVERARRQQKTSAMLVMFDLAGLKQINDIHGHPAGDAYIKALAKGLNTVRATDYVGRLGGDEFALLLTDAEPEAMHRRVMQLVSHLNGLQIQYGQQTFQLRVSHGSIGVNPGESAPALVAAADKKLYACKTARKAH